MDMDDVEDFEGLIEGSFISITIRSLSGAEINFPQLSLLLSVRDLKSLIAEQNDNFPVSSQKLIKGRTTLEDHKTLGDYNLKNGDSVHVVKKLEELDDLEDDGPGPFVRVTGSTDDSTITVVVPEGARTGTRLLINPPGREQMSVTVPSGVRAGDRFQVRLPPRGGNRSRNSTGRGGAASSSGGGAGGQIMQVTCPANARGGQQILIEVPNRGRMRVEVPRGIRPGQTFRFRVPT